MAKVYDESAVQTVDALTHIRMRSGMYIGRLGDGSQIDDGIYVLLKEVIDNSIDEFIMHHGDRILITIDEKNQMISVRDYGRGIPLGKVLDCVSQINTGAKYNDDVFQFSVGLNGVGLKAVNALASHFMVTSYRDKQAFTATFSRGKLLSKKEVSTKEKNGTYVEFIPDKEIFGRYAYEEPLIRKRLWHYAYLNRGLTLLYNQEAIQSEHGLLDLLNAEVSNEALFEPFHYRSEHLEFAFVHTQSYGESYFSFVNGQYTADGGTHLSAFREGILKGVNEYAKKNFQGVDVREGIVGTILVKVKDPIFESQTKNKLSNVEIRTPLVQDIKQAVFHLLHTQESVAKKIIEKITFNEKLRKELSAVRKEAKEKQKKISFKIPKLRDCKYHLTDQSPYKEKTMIFLTEGESASASIAFARDPFVQAIFSLRGKPLNVHGMQMDQLYKNEEMFNLMMALNIEEDLAELRYQKIILATDADVDGMHIRNLLITFFLTYFEALVQNGHLFILDTPLFKVRDTQTIFYCYNEKEKEEKIEFFQKKKSKQVEVTRFKGLGEISPPEFKQFITGDMKLIPVVVSAFSEVKPTLEFYMGKNTPKRKEFIMQNLIVED